MVLLFSGRHSPGHPWNRRFDQLHRNSNAPSNHQLLISTGEPSYVDTRGDITVLADYVLMMTTTTVLMIPVLPGHIKSSIIHTKYHRWSLDYYLKHSAMYSEMLQPMNERLMGISTDTMLEHTNDMTSHHPLCTLLRVLAVLGIHARIMEIYPSSSSSSSLSSTFTSGVHP